MDDRRLTSNDAAAVRERNKRIAVLHEAAHCLAVRAEMVAQLARQKGYSGLQPEDEYNHERADRLRFVAAFLGSPALRDYIKDSPTLEDLLLDPQPVSWQGVDFTAPKALRQRSTGRPYEERLKLPDLLLRALGLS